MTETEAARRDDRADHRAFLNDYYGWARGSYDWTRRFYLLGRDRVLDELARDDWQSLLEIGPGTGRNLARLHRRRPDAMFGGLDACDAMLEVAARRCPWARLAQGFAEDADLAAILGRRPDRILLSYCLSMVQDPAATLANTRRALAPGGRVVLVDFGDSGDLPSLFGGALRSWLHRFHVEPIDPNLLRELGAHLRYGPGRYWLSASLGPASDPDLDPALEDEREPATGRPAASADALAAHHAEAARQAMRERALARTTPEAPVPVRSREAPT